MEADQPNDDLQRQVLQSTLDEIAIRQEDDTDCCVICLEGITEVCEAVPCQHRNFDFLCLLSWLEQSPKCPLCKAAVSQVRHALDEPVAKTYVVPKPATPPQAERSDSRPYAPSSFRRHLLPPRRRPYPRHQHYETSNPNPSDEIARRRDVYRRNQYSKHVGSNRLSRYRELTPSVFCTDGDLVSRARMWIRRELQVFSFLTPDASEHAESRTGDADARSAVERRRANNAEFLLEYIIAVLKSVDIMGSAGQAEDMIADFLGRENTRLFLHELRAWLRSPYTKLADWDRAVQYDDTPAASSWRRDSEQDRGSDSQARRQPKPAPGRRERPEMQGDFYRPGGGRSQKARSTHRREPHIYSVNTSYAKMPNISITAISDPVCPWCYIGALRLTRAIALYRKTVSSSDTVTTTWHAYQLDPHAETQPLVSKMAAKFGGDKVSEVQARLRDMARREGLEFNFGSTIGNTRDAHRLEKLARHKGLETGLALEVMKMYFEDGGDITSADDLVLAAKRAGIDGGEARAWLDGGDGGNEVDREVLEMQEKGIRGVPRYVINGKFTVDGAEDVGVILEQLVLAREEALNES
ncbi:hypothetical protein FZEAL_9484 [Fusarium zealandicum]|uniref:RING-type E3 ubiquitin transferase n=1 Tax=Fusarium zealandicum TaxID=1053134 RepID=A0A8H4XG65_9HYPO|nr:hypothetical protein FZEAL_9484 [Fusarium zealandicum]